MPKSQLGGILYIFPPGCITLDTLPRKDIFFNFFIIILFIQFIFMKNLSLISFKN